MTTTSRSDLEKALALLAWQMRAQRMTPREHAIYTNSLVGKKTDG
jgi:hypothetical protein